MNRQALINRTKVHYQFSSAMDVVVDYVIKIHGEGADPNNYEAEINALIDDGAILELEEVMYAIARALPEDCYN